MTQVIDPNWKECLKDSPKFRSMLEEQEKDLDSFESHLEKVIKYSDTLVEHAKSFQSAYNNFLGAFKSLMIHFKDDPDLLEAIGKFNETSTNWHFNYQSMLERCYSNIARVLSGFVKGDLKKVKDVRKAFIRGSADVESAFAKNAQVSKSRPDDCIEANSHLMRCRNHFKRISLDYVYELKNVQMRKKMQVLSCMSTHFDSQEFFLQQMNETFEALRPYIKLMNFQVQKLQDDVSNKKVKIKSEIDVVLEEDFRCISWDAHKTSSVDANFLKQQQEEEANAATTMEGYLYKRTSNAFKSWVRRWFIVEHNQLLYCSQHRSRDGAVVLEKDLRLCNVVDFEDTERRFCLQVKSPERTHLLQAENAVECVRWVEAIREAAKEAYNKMTTPVSHKSLSEVVLRPQAQPSFRRHSVKSPSSHSISHMREISNIAGNDVCCDCGCPDPTWASFNLGVTLCIECSGIHRSFGVHRSKVKSVTLDAWESDQIQVMTALGNHIVNRIFEKFVDESSVARATPSCNREVRVAWISEKYIKRSFVRCKKPPTSRPSSRATTTATKPLTASSNHLADDDTTPTEEVSDVHFQLNESYHESVGEVNNSDLPHSVVDWLEKPIDGPMRASQLLCQAAEEGCLAGMLRCMAEGGDVNHVGEGGKNPLICSLASGELAPVEFMLLNGAKVDQPDHKLQTSLHHAAMLGNASQICLLLKRKANQHLKDVNGRDALAIAIEKADANVVTILRVALLKNEMRNSEGGFDNANEDMFAEVFRDFSCINSTKNLSSYVTHASTIGSTTAT